MIGGGKSRQIEECKVREKIKQRQKQEWGDRGNLGFGFNLRQCFRAWV